MRKRVPTTSVLFLGTERPQGATIGYTNWVRVALACLWCVMGVGVWAQTTPTRAQGVQAFGAQVVPNQPTNANHPLAVSSSEVLVMREAGSLSGARANLGVNGSLGPDIVAANLSCDQGFSGPVDSTLVHFEPGDASTRFALLLFDQPVTGLVFSTQECFTRSDQLIRPSDHAAWFPEGSVRELGTNTGDDLVVGGSGHVVAVRLKSSDTDMDQVRIFTETPDSTTSLALSCRTASYAQATGSSSLSTSVVLQRSGDPSAPLDAKLWVKLPARGSCQLDGDPCNVVPSAALSDVPGSLPPALEALAGALVCDLPADGSGDVGSLVCTWDGDLGDVTLRALGGSDSPGAPRDCVFSPPILNEPDGGISDASVPGDSGMDAGGDAGPGRDAATEAGTVPAPGASNYGFQGGGSCAASTTAPAFPWLACLGLLVFLRRRDG